MQCREIREAIARGLVRLAIRLQYPFQRGEPRFDAIILSPCHQITDSALKSVVQPQSARYPDVVFLSYDPAKFESYAVHPVVKPSVLSPCVQSPDIVNGPSQEPDPLLSDFAKALEEHRESIPVAIMDHIDQLQRQIDFSRGGKYGPPNPATDCDCTCPNEENTREMTPDYSHWRKHGIMGKLTHVRIADMQNDIDLTRKILAAIREKDNLRPAPIQLHDYEAVLVMRHVKRLLDDEMIEGRVSEALGMEAPMAFVTDMTTAGHSFLGALEDDKLWNRVKASLSPTHLATLSMKQIATLTSELALKQGRDLLGL